MPAVFAGVGAAAALTLMVLDSHDAHTMPVSPGEGRKHDSPERQPVAPAPPGTLASMP